MRTPMRMPFVGLAVCCWIQTWLGAEGPWRPTANSMLTPWGERLNPAEVWPDYPRPQMERAGWSNLNGLWAYAVAQKDAEKPSEWTGKILVPFAIEAPLSGVGRRLQPTEALWYRRFVDLAKKPDGRLLLHFEAVDYAAEVWLNGQEVGQHVGGSLPFSFDVTARVAAGSNELVVRVLDATDTPGTYQLRGKQTLDLDRRIFYTPVSGIWQTVWLEEVPASYIKSLRIGTELSGKITLQPEIVGSGTLRSTAYFNGKEAATGGTTLAVPAPKLWSPSAPNLYDLKIELIGADGTAVDVVKSYTGIRQVGKVKDRDGNWRLTLNDDVIFHFGPLDQGWWPDGLLTPPSAAAMLFDLKFLKDSGFNMIRKHIKVEPRRYYYECDRLGFLVWQDQVSGGTSQQNNEWPKWKRLREDKKNNPPTDRQLDGDWPEWAHQQWMAEFKGMVDLLGNHASVVVWTPFNERWGQHRTMEVGQWIVGYDPTRPVNLASGGNFFPVGDMADEHSYPDPSFMLNAPEYKDFVRVVGEFGGHGWPVDGHLWKSDKQHWGYGGLPKDAQEFKDRYRKSVRTLSGLKSSGVAAGVYTQTTDVEGEINGLITYDRKVIKIPAAELKKIHQGMGL